MLQHCSEIANNRHPKCFSLKVMVKDIFLHNGGHRNVLSYVTRSNSSRYILKGPDPSYLVFKFANMFAH